jgi:nucleoside-diphosphate kinase
VERTLVIVKPDAVQRGLIGTILSRLEQRGLKLAALKLAQLSREQAEGHYAEHRGKPFFEPLVGYITSAPVVLAVFEGRDAVQVVRNTMGATNPVNSAPGTIRGDFALEVGRNLIHGSDGPDSAVREVDFFFSTDELISYTRDTDRWIHE